MASLNIAQLKLPLPAGLDTAVLMAKLPPIVNVVMVVLLANALAGLTWMIVPVPETPPPPISSQAQSSVRNVASNQNRVTSNASEIARWHLFGTLQKELPKPPPVPEVAPDTTLNLTLRGVFASTDARYAWAIIADQSRNEETYGIEDNLPGGAVLKEIHADRIILLRNNRFETLRLPRDEMDDGRRIGNVRSNRVSRSNITRQSSRIARSGATTVTPEASRILSEYRQKLISDPQSVMNAVRAEPYRRGGRLAGYRVFPGRDKQLMAQVGLQPGDVVTSVNGISLDSPLKGLEIMKQISQAGSSQVTVDILRNGVTQQFVVPVN
jgi:general secretion pathway protein C